MIRIFIISVFLFCLNITFAQSNKLLLQVEDIQTINGSIMIAAFDNKTDFKTKENPVFADTLIIEGTSIITQISLPKGIYAVAIFHDENSDGTLNKAKFGIPTEGVGFSGSIKAINKPPKFSDCSFVLSNDTIILIKMHYRSSQ